MINEIKHSVVERPGRFGIIEVNIVRIVMKLKGWFKQTKICCIHIFNLQDWFDFTEKPHQVVLC